MRWGYLIPRLIIVAIIWAFFALGFDPMLRYSAQQSLQAITDAKADVDVVETGFFPPRGSVRRVALASASKPGTNLVQFDEMKFHLAGAPLLRRSYVVDEAVVTGVRFGTSRNDNGQLERVEDPDADSGPVIPEWMSEKLKNMGDEWLENFTQQAKTQIDPNRLETYRVGNEIYVKWDGRFSEINLKIQTTKQQLDALEKQIKAAKEGETLEQVQKYLQAAQSADLLIRDSNQFFLTYRNSLPHEIAQDFKRLDQAQINDRENIAHTIQLLKPDARRISESLIGEEMYVQLQQMLTWVEFIRGSIGNVKQPPPPERYRGRTFEFPLLNPTPKLLCKKMLIDGELMLSNVPTPFRAVLTDVTSDPKLHGRPALLQVSTAGELPVQLVIRHDATTDIATTDLTANYVDQKEQHLRAGKEGGDMLTASLSNLRWDAQVTLVEGQIQGQIDVASDFGSGQFQTKTPYAAALAGVAEDTLASIQTLNARLTLNGPVLKPDVTMTSDIGQKVVAGFETAFAANLPQMKQHAATLVAGYADDYKKKLSAKLGERHKLLEGDYASLKAKLEAARTLAMNLRSGQVDPNAVYKQVSQSGVLSDKDQKKADKYMGRFNEVLGGAKDPHSALQNALPGLRKKLFR